MLNDTRIRVERDALLRLHYWALMRLRNTNHPASMSPWVIGVSPSKVVVVDFFLIAFSPSHRNYPNLFIRLGGGSDHHIPRAAHTA